jgi:outer membrane protein assembly factor BamB
VPKLRLNASPSANWVTPANVMPPTVPVYQQGAIYYANDLAQLQAVDFQTGTTLWTASAIANIALQSPIWVNGLIYIANDAGQLFAISPVNGSAIWPEPVTITGASSLTTPTLGLGYVDGAGQQLVLYLMDSQNVYLVPLTGLNGATPVPQTVYTATGFTLGTSLVYDATTGYMILNTSQGLAALSANIASADPWTLAWQAALGGFVTPASSAMGKIFVGTPSQTMAIVDIATGESIASQSLNSNIEQPILVYPNTNSAFVPTASGVISILDATSARKTTEFQPGGQVTTPLTLNENLVYYGSADSNVYAFDITDATSQAVSYLADGAIAYLAGVTAASAYFGTGTAMHSADFGDVIHQFNSQSQLMVDYVPATEGGQPQQVPSYQTHITLYDDHNNIRPNEAVKIWSVTPATLLADNQTFQIGPTTPAAFQSDATGRVALSVPASTDIQPGVGSGLSTPALLLWASFMDLNERILVYPDQRLHAKLQAISGADLQNAASYNSSDPTQPGPALLPAGFQGSQGLSNANALASAINNSISLQAPATTVSSPAGDVPTTYLAFPQTMLGVQYCATPPNPARAPAQGQYPNWTLTMPAAGGSATFTPHASAGEAVSRAASSRAINGLGPAGNIFTDIRDFIENVINGIEQVVETVWQYAENAVTAAINTVENTYNLVIQTIEDAAHVVLGILTTVVGDIVDAVEKIIEALSWLFDWDDILATHTQIRTIINNAFGETTQLISNLESQTNTFFDGLKSTITSDFQSLISQITGTLGQSTQNYNDPNQLYSQGSDNYTVQGNWLYHKSMTGALGPNGSVSVGGSSLQLAPQAAQESLAQAMEQFLEAVAADALQVAENLGELVLSAVNELITVISDPNQVSGASLATLLGNLENLLLSLVQLAEDATDAFFTLVQLVVGLVQTALNATIDIPLVSDLYSWITGGDSLTILDLFCLIVAVPTTVVYKVITGQAPFSTSADGKLLTASGSLDVENMIVTFGAFIYVFVDAVSNAMGNESPAFLNYFEAVLIAIAQAIATPYQYTGGQLTDYGLLWLYEWFPVIWGAHSGMQQSAGQTVSAVVLPFHGIGTAIWEGAYAIKYPSDFFDDGIKLVQNELGALSTIAGFAKLSENPEVLAGLVVACFFLDMGNALIEIKYWWPSAAAAPFAIA